MTDLRKAKLSEAEKILEFYRNIINSTKNTDFNPKWNEHYPNLEYIKTNILNGEMYVHTENDDVVACLILNNQFNPDYENINWNIDAGQNEILVIHTFAVHPDLTGKGIGKEIFNQIKNNAMENNKKTIRIDIIDGNIGAEKVFKKFGFEYVDTAELFHEAVGLEKFHLYEYILRH